MADPLVAQFLTVKFLSKTSATHSLVQLLVAYGTWCNEWSLEILHTVFSKFKFLYTEIPLNVSLYTEFSPICTSWTLKQITILALSTWTIRKMSPGHLECHSLPAWFYPSTHTLVPWIDIPLEPQFSPRRHF